MAKQVKTRNVVFLEPVSYTRPNRDGTASETVKVTRAMVRAEEVVQVPEYVYQDIKNNKRKNGKPCIRFRDAVDEDGPASITIEGSDSQKESGSQKEEADVQTSGASKAKK